MNNKTINYYNKYTKSFIQTTRSVDFTNIQNKFLSYLPSGASILDFGCGSGRDTKYFLKRNYNERRLTYPKRFVRKPQNIQESK